MDMKCGCNSRPEALKQTPMSLKTRRTEHTGYLTGSDAQKEYDDKASLKWDSNRRRRQYDKEVVCQALAEIDYQTDLSAMAWLRATLKLRNDSPSP